MIGEFFEDSKIIITMEHNSFPQFLSVTYLPLLFSKPLQFCGCFLVWKMGCI